MKPVLLVVIDALASRVVRPALAAGQLPHLQALLEAGYGSWRCTAIFPSITPAATASLATGNYPAETGIMGAYFYDRQQDRVHYYGDDIWAIMRRGSGAFFEDFLVRLNRDHLQCETVFQLVERAGKRAACLNYFWFRGEVSHQVHVPWLLWLWPSIPYSKSIRGPSLLSLGDFVSARIRDAGPRLQGPGGMFRRFGFSDANTRAALLQLAQEETLPDFTLAYFPDNDFDSHEQGPQAWLAKVQEVDRTLGEFIELRGGLQQMLQSLAVVITGDHAQTDLPHDKESSGIRLDELLADYSIVPAGDDWHDGEELMICPNMRAAQIYLRPGYLARLEEIAARLVTDERVDQVIWRTQADSSCTYHVLTRHGELVFASGDGEDATACDEYGNPWHWEGNLASVDGEVRDGVLLFGDYPNAFERIASAFDQQASGDLWVTSRPGYELRLRDTSIHAGGSHGSLHAEDSFSPLILAGIAAELYPRQTPRGVDIVPLCLAAMELESPHAVGQGRAQGASTAHR